MASEPALPLPDVERMAAEDVLLWAYEKFGGRMCLTCSWQRQSSVLVHMVSELGVPEADLPSLAADAAQRGGNLANPRPASPGEIEVLMRAVF